jgi:hypothetical protein
MFDPSENRKGEYPNVSPRAYAGNPSHRAANSSDIKTPKK